MNGSTPAHTSRAALYRQRRLMKGKGKTVLFDGDDYAASKSQVTSINIFFWGLVIIEFSYVMGITGNKVLTPALCQGLQTIGLIMMIYSSVNLMKFTFESKYLEMMFTAYMVYSLVIVGRIQNTQYDAIKSMIFNPGLGILPYFVPFCVLLPRKFYLLKRAFYTLAVFGVLFLIFVIAYYNVVHDGNWANLTALAYIENFNGAFAFPVSFLLLVYIYNSKRLNQFAFLITLVALYFLIFRARRGSMFLTLTTLLGAGMVYLIYTKRTVLVIALSVFLVFFGSVFMSNIKLPSMFDFLMSRKDEDTRTGMEVYMKADMTTTDWIFGKGINGKYFCPVILDPNDLTGQRDIIETGYLQIILKGGILQLGIYLLILIPALYKGLFKSNNILSKGCGIFILLSIVYMYPTIVTGFGIYTILLWISVGICYSDKMRNLPDIAIKSYLERLK
ncbi:MAG: hypothetical protein JST86_02535 [Bacteroidetes bacterium]|nr:hypothetical protein [Bacteroidota bacterium]